MTTTFDYDSSGRITRRYTSLGYSDYIYEDGSDWLLRETWHSYVPPYNVFDPYRYWYANGRPIRMDTPEHIAPDWSQADPLLPYYLEYNWHGDIVGYVPRDGVGGGDQRAFDPWGISSGEIPMGQYYQWNGGWGYMAFGSLGMYYIHGRWYNPWVGRFISPDEKGGYLYGSGNDAVNEMWTQFLAGVFYQVGKNNADTFALPVYIINQPAHTVYVEVMQNFETYYLPNTVPTRFGRYFGSSVTVVQGISEIFFAAPTIAGGGTVLSCLLTGAESGGGGCAAGAVVSVGAAGVVLVHGLAVTGVSIWNGGQIGMSLMSGRGGSGGREFNPVDWNAKKPFEGTVRNPNGTTTEYRVRNSPGADGGWSRIAITRDANGNVIEVRHEAWSGALDPRFDPPDHVDYHNP